MKSATIGALIGVVVAAAVVAGCGAPSAAGGQRRTTPATTTPSQVSGVDLPALLGRGVPGEFHGRLDALVGEWTVDKQTYIAAGTLQNPKIWVGQSRWQWLGDTGNRFIHEELTGDLGGGPYYRMGVLGYSTLDGRYEWNTLDNVLSVMMTYKGAPDTGGDDVISMSGEFTDPGVLGESYVGKRIGMRTVITFQSADTIMIEIKFVPPGEPERMADRGVYHRKKG